MKQKIFKKGIMKRLFSMVLALTMISGMMSGMTLTVQALEGYDDVQIDGDTYLYNTALLGTDYVGIGLICVRDGLIAEKNHEGDDRFRIKPETMDAFLACRDAGHIGQKCTVTFDVQGYGIAPEPQIMMHHGRAWIPEDPCAEGLVFGGWFVDSDCNLRYNFDLGVDQDITLYAKWLTPYTVTFDVQEHGTAPAFQTVYGGEKATKPTDPTAAGFQFEGWYKEAACENEWDFDSDEVTDDITLYAKWTEAGPVVCGLCVNCGHAFDHGPDEGRDCMACDVSPEGPCFGSGAQNAKACVLEKGHAGNHHAHNSDAYGANEYRHWTKCTEDELNNGTEDFHDWSNCDGVCAICEYVCQHTGETSRICFVCDKILSGGSIAGCTVNGSKAHWKFDHWDEANSVYVGEFYSMNGNKEFNALAECFDEGQTPGDLPGQVWWLGGDYLTACPGNHDGDSTGPQTYNFKDLAVGTVVNAGDTILRTGDDSGWLYFGSSYFSLAPMELAWPGYYMNDLESWTMGTDFPAIRSADAPDWYATSKSFVVTEVAVDGDWIYVRLAPNHTCTYTADGASITATCDKSCGAETAHTATMTLTPDGVNPTSVDGGTYFTGMTGLSLKTDDFKIYKTETEGAVTGGVEVQGKMETGGYYYVSLTLGEATAVKAFIGRRVLTFAELEQGTVLSVGDAIARTSGMKGWLVFGNNYYFGLASSDNQEDVLNGAAYWVFGSELPAISSGTMPSWYASTTTFVVTTIISQDQSYTVYFEPNHTWSYEADGAVVTATCDRECGAEKAHVLTLTLSAEDTEMIVGSNETITYNKQETSGTLSTENLGTPTVWKYNGKNYEVYNEFISSTLGTTWNDAMAFVAKLNAAKYGGHDNWQLLNAVGGMGWQYYSDKVYDGYDPGSTIYLWEEACDANGAFFVNLRNGNWGTLEKSDSYYLLGFVILCGSDVASAGTKEEVAAWNEMFGTGMIPYIHYTGKAGSTTTLEDTTVEPLALGSYTASLTVGGVTVTKDFSITKLSQTLTFAENEVNKTYGDEAFIITVNGAETTVTYASNNTEVATVNATTGAVTILKAGTVTITATAAEDETHAEATASYTLTVGKATPTVTAVPTASAITYGQTLANSTLTGGAASVQGAFAWTTSTTAPAVSDSGKTEYAVTFTPNDTTNYNTATCKVKVTVNKATGSGSVTMNGWTYGGTPSDPVPTSTTNGTGSVTYAYKVKNAADSTYAAATPTNAGTYTVKATFAATDNYTQATATADFTIAKASQDAPAASEGYTLDYTNETLKAKTGYEVSSTNGETATALTGNKVNPGSEAKTCYVRKPASDTNHADSAWTMITIPARPAATDLTGTMETIKNKRDASLSGVTSAMEYRMGTETNWTAGTGAVIANPDNLTIYVRTRATAGAFAGETQTIEFTPGDKLLTVTMGEAAQNVAYGAKVDKPANPEKSDYTFGGWYSDEECTQAWNFAIDTVKDNMTLYPKWIKNAVQKAAISGKVTENSVGVPGATVELYLGVGKIAAATTDASGNYSFDNVENGTYNIVVTKGDKTKTELVTVDSTGSFTADVELPTKAVSSKVEHKGTAVADAKSDIKETVVGGLDAIAAAQTVTPGGKVTIKLTVEPKAESDVASASEIKALAGNGKKVEFLDLSLLMQTNSESPVDIGNTNNTLLTIVIPFDYSDVDVSSVMILRNHGSSEKLMKNPADGQEGFTVNAAEGTITIYAKKFSDYAVAYSNASHGGGSYTPGHTVTSDLKSVTKVTIDGKVVDSRYYTVSGGNIILSGEFMKTLANGKHTVKLYDGAKVATGIMTVSGNVAVISAATGDMGVALYVALSVSSILGMGWVGKKKRDDE